MFVASCYQLRGLAEACLPATHGCSSSLPGGPTHPTRRPSPPLILPWGNQQTRRANYRFTPHKAGTRRVVISAVAQRDVEAQASLTAAVRGFKAALGALPSDALSSLPGNLKDELKDAGFSLSSGPVLLELGDELGGLVLDFGQGLEQASLGQVVEAGSSLAAGLEGGAALPGSSQSAVLGRRLTASGRLLAGMGSLAPKEVTELGAAMLRAGSELSKGSRESPVDAAAVYGRSFKIGSLEVEVAASTAVQGSLVAAVFSALAWRLALGVDTAGGSTEYASQGATLAASSLQQALLFVGYGSAVLSLVISLGLAALAVQLSSSEKPKKD